MPKDLRRSTRRRSRCGQLIVRRMCSTNSRSEMEADNRVRRAIEAALGWARGEITMTIARAAAVEAHAAARASHHPAAVAAARAAGHAAGTAHMIGHARNAAAYAIVSAVTASATDEQDCAASSEREWQIARLPTRAAHPFLGEAEPFHSLPSWVVRTA